MSESANASPECCIEIGSPYRLDIQGERIRTGIAYPRSIFLRNLDRADRAAVVRGAELLGKPTVEQWLGLRAGAAERRLRACPLLVTGLVRFWPQDVSPVGLVDISPVRPGGSGLVTALAFLVGDRLLKGGVFDTGSKAWRIEEQVAHTVLALTPLVRRGSTGPDQALAVLVARLAGSVKKRLCVSRAQLDENVTVEDHGFDAATDRLLISSIAEALAATGDKGSAVIVRFMRRPELWDLSRSEQAKELGVTYTNWRQIISRSLRQRRTREASTERGAKK